MKPFAYILLTSLAVVSGARAQETQNISAGLTAAGAPLAIHGFDPVAYFTVGLPTEGSAKFTATHKGAAYRFASAANKSAFERNPAQYLPQFGGFCAFGVTVEKKFDGDPRVFAIVDGKLYLNLHPEIQAMWHKDTRGNIKKAGRLWAAVRSTPAHGEFTEDEVNVTASLTAASKPLALHGFDPVAYFSVGAATRGSAKFTATHEGAAYRFASAANKAAFERSPTRYLPQFGGFCAFGVSVGKKFDGDPRIFEIVDDKLYLNLNPEIQSLWRKDTPGTIAKARAKWPGIRGTAARKL